MRATHKLFNEKSTATGFVLAAEDGRNFLVTAAHVFEKMEGEAAVAGVATRTTLPKANSIART